jgi:hypothetical protein
VSTRVAPHVAWLLLMPLATAGQDLEPRAYSASPVGTNFIVLGLGRSTGAVVFDPALPIKDVSAKVGAATLGLGRTFEVAGRMCLLTVALPYAWGAMTGLVSEEARRISRSGLPDGRIKFSVNLWGNPALSPADFAKAVRRRVVGASLTDLIPFWQ